MPALSIGVELLFEQSLAALPGDSARVRKLIYSATQRTDNDRYAVEREHRVE